MFLLLVLGEQCIQRVRLWLWDQPWTEPEIAFQSLRDITVLVLERPTLGV